MSRRRVSQYVAAALFALVLLAGCSGNPPRFVDEDNVYSADQALELPLDVHAGAVAGRPAEDAEELRTDTLAALRREGGEKADIAALITQSLPVKSRGVPIYIELAEVDKVSSIIVVEAVGRDGGKLDGKRVWVLNRAGEVLLMGNR